MKLAQFDNHYETRIREAAAALSPSVGKLIGTNYYSDLLKLDANTLKNLVAFESAKVEKIESQQEDIDGHTSGHHRDCMDIYISALEGESKPFGCFVYACESGKLFFDPFRDVLLKLTHTKVSISFMDILMKVFSLRIDAAVASAIGDLREADAIIEDTEEILRLIGWAVGRGIIDRGNQFDLRWQNFMKHYPEYMVPFDRGVIKGLRDKVAYQ